MCLGVPGLVVSLEADHPDLAIVNVSGKDRPINLGLLDGDVGEGDWVMIHMGFALEKMSAEEAEDALEVLNTLGPNAGGAPIVEDEFVPPW